MFELNEKMKQSLRAKATAAFKRYGSHSDPEKFIDAVVDAELESMRSSLRRSVLETIGIDRWNTVVHGSPLHEAIRTKAQSIIDAYVPEIVSSLAITKKQRLSLVNDANEVFYEYLRMRVEEVAEDRAQDMEEAEIFALLAEVDEDKTNP